MVDTVSFLLGTSPVKVFAVCISGNADEIPNYDNVQVTLTYKDGSIAQLCYVANSDPSRPQERIEMHWEGCYGLIDNFRLGEYSYKGRRKRFRRVSQNKGWMEETANFIDCLRSGNRIPIPYTSLVETTWTTFLIHSSLETGQVVPLPDISECL
jgi:polar amino acid transport system substrate-binding protein